MLRHVPRRAVAMVLLILAGGLLSSCYGADSYPQTSLESAGPHTGRINDVYALIWWGAVAVFVLVQGLLIFALFKFRKEPKTAHGRPVPVHGNNRLEIIWTVIPAIILAIIAVPTLQVISETSARPEGDDVLVVEVIGHQFFWEYQYPDLGVSATNDLHIPVNTRVDLHLMSADVIHSFWVPQLNGKRDVLPGRFTHLRIEADEPGLYLGQCAEFCGLAHADMRQRVFAHTPDEFEAWAAAHAQPAAIPESGPAAEGWELFQLACASCHAIDGTTATAELAPNLTHFASRTSFGGAAISNTREHLAQWLRDPVSLKPMTPELNDIAAGRILGMPNLGLSEDDIDKLIAFLDTLE